MRRIGNLLLIAVFAVPGAAQTGPGSRRVMRPVPPGVQVGVAESAVKQAMDLLAADKKAYDRDL
jgi:hypothetical protein